MSAASLSPGARPSASRVSLLALLVSAAAASPALPLYKDAGAPIPARVADLVSRMNVTELIAAVAHKDNSITEAQLRSQYGATGIGGITSAIVMEGSGGAAETLARRNALQADFMATSRLGIPISFAHEGLHCGAPWGTCFPMPLLTACSWNDSLPALIGGVLASEARAYGVDNVWSPVVNMWTDDRFGRYQEGFSPDPTLTSHMARALVLGVQGGPSAPDDYLPGGFNTSAWSTAKHFAGYGSAAGGLNGAPFALNNRTLFEQFLRPWRAMAAVGLRGAMPSHNAVLDVPMHQNAWLINTVLRGEFGFGNGMTVSDCNDIGAAFYYGTSANQTHCTALGVRAGVDADLQCGYSPATSSYIERLPDALADGLITLADLRVLAGHYLTQKFAAGLFDAPQAPPAGLARLDTPAHRALAYEAAAQSLVLLTNPRGALPLPLASGGVKSVALVGAFNTCGGGAGAACFGRQAMLGSYVLDAGTTAVDLLPAAFAARFPGVALTVTEGASPDSADTSGVAAAAAAAAAADVAVVLLGDSLKTCGEWLDRDDLDLPGGQLPLLGALLNTSTPVVVVLVHGRAASFGAGNALLPRAAAVVEAWRPGEMGAYAIVDVLSGAVNPSGKLASQWAQGVGQLGSGAQPWLQRRVAKWVANARSAPDPTDGRVYDPYVTSGYATSAPLFRFGHGLSYTAFNYTTIDVAVLAQPRALAAFSGRGRAGYAEAAALAVLSVAVGVCNVGLRDGVEVVQVYSQDPRGAFNTPIVPHWKRLVGYGRLPLAAGACGRLTVPVLADDLALYDDGMTLRVVAGTYVISAGGRSDQDTLQANVTLA